MNAFLLYLLYGSICMALFYLFYMGVLRRLTFFRWNRFYLLSTLALSAIIPMLDIRIDIKSEAPVNDFISSWSIELNERAGLSGISSDTGVNWSTILITAYFTGVFFMLIQFAVSLYKISKASRTREHDRFGSIRVVKGTALINNCSFFNTVFLNKGSLSKAEYEQVISHEECHVKLYHTYDKLFTHLMQIFFWFNPFVYLYRRLVDEVHEFQVDAMRAEALDRQSYANLLLQFVMKKQVSLLNSFGGRSIKSRVQMLFSKRSTRINSLKYFTGILLLAFIIMSFGIRPYIKRNNEDGVPIKYNTLHPPVVIRNEPVQQAGLPGGSNTGTTDRPGKLQKPLATSQTKPSPEQSQDISNEPEAPPFFTKTSTIDRDGREVDEIRLKFGNSNLVGAIRKGGRILFIIHGKKYEEADLVRLSREDILQFSCPCQVRIIDRDKEPLLYEEYEGVIEIKGK